MSPSNLKEKVIMQIMVLIILEIGSELWTIFMTFFQFT
jgi:hypothetical protein